MLSHLSVEHSLRTKAFVAYLCAAEDSEGTSGPAQSAANTPRYQALDVQGASCPPQNNRNRGNWGVSHGLAAHPPGDAPIADSHSRPPMGTPLVLSPCLR